MRGGRNINYKAILLAILVITSLVVPLLAMSKPSQATVYPTVDNIVVRGKDTAYSYNNNPPDPTKTYVQGDNPPMMMVDQIGSGRVVAFGDVTEYREAANDNFAALTDAIFRWLDDNKSPGATNIEWFNGYGVFITSSSATGNLDKLRAMGYTITGSVSTPINPAGYDILVLPEMQLGSGHAGGDPSLLSDVDVANIRNFVEGGGGLLIMSGSDFFGPSGDKGNFYKVTNKVLENLGFGYGGQLFGFQSDSVYDEQYNSDERGTIDVRIPGGTRYYTPVVDVNILHPIGQAYQAATGRTDFRAYGGCSLVQLGKGMAVSMIPNFGVGLPGDTLTYKFYITNTGVPIPGAENVDLTITLTKTDNAGWNPTLDNSSIYLPQDNSYYVIVRVTIPSGTALSAEDTITVTATAGDIVQSLSCVAKAGQRLDPTDDSYVRSDQPDTNLGDNTNLEVGRFEGTSDNTFYNAYLKFNLADIPSGKTITEARLYAFCYHAYGAPGQMNTNAVDDDSWDEHSITYNNAPTPVATLDTQTVSIGSSSQPVPYSWDVTSYIQSQYTDDQVASLEITRASETPSTAYRWFDAKEWYDNGTHTYLMVIYSTETNPVPRVSISPSSQDNSPSGSLTYTVKVSNTGTVSDTFSLAVSDNAGWSPTVSPTPVTVAAGENGTATLNVTIPSSAVGGTIDSITVTATSQAYSTSASASCVARALVTGKVEVTIEPATKSGAKGATITYSVTVTNNGPSSDTFSLTASDTKGWGPTLTITSTTLAAGASRAGIKLSITVPSSASVGDTSTITVTATGTGYDNTATCTATAAASSGTSVLLYVVIAVVVIVIIAVVIIVLI